MMKRIIGNLGYVIAILLSFLMMFYIVSPRYLMESSNIVCMLIIISSIIIGSTFILVKDNKEIEYRRKMIQYTIRFIFIIYMIMVVYVMIFNRLDYINALDRRQINIIPLKEIISMIYKVITNELNSYILYENIIGNIIMFFPLGILLPLIFKYKNNTNKDILLKSLIIIVILEIIQCIVCVGSFDVDDIILNMIGVYIACLIRKNTIYKIFIEKLY